MIYRVKQFFWGVGSYFKPTDIDYVNENLTPEEKDIFFKLKNSEQQHSIRVAKLCDEFQKQYKHINAKKLRTLALLHDIGKIGTTLTVIDKSILVIINKITRGRIQKSKSKKVDIYYNHGEYGALLLENLGYDEDIVYAVRNHHNNNADKTDMLDILQKCDNIS